MFNRKIDKKGFSLIELLIVIAIIGILSSVILVSFQSSRAKGRDTKRIADIGAIQTALALYADSNASHYPDTLADLAAFNPRVLADEPVAPNFNATGEVYLYTRTNDGLSYHLGAILEQINEGDGVLRGDRDCNSGVIIPPDVCPGFTVALSHPDAAPFDGTVQNPDVRVYDVTP